MTQPVITDGENAAATDTPAMTLAQTASACEERMLSLLYIPVFPPPAAGFRENFDCEIFRLVWHPFTFGGRSLLRCRRAGWCRRESSWPC